VTSISKSEYERGADADSAEARGNLHDLFILASVSNPHFRFLWLRFSFYFQDMNRWFILVFIVLFIVLQETLASREDDAYVRGSPPVLRCRCLEIKFTRYINIL